MGNAVNMVPNTKALFLLGPQLGESKKKVQVQNGFYSGVLNSNVCTIDTYDGQVEFKVLQGIRGSAAVDVFVKNAKAEVFEKYDENANTGDYGSWTALVASVLFVLVFLYHSCTK
jgi:hypothetical protein